MFYAALSKPLENAADRVKVNGVHILFERDSQGIFFIE